MSMYQNTSQYSNVPQPYRAPYPHYIPFLNGGNPETLYPYDGLYDKKYQAARGNPKYQHYGSMDYPHYVQRHNQPQVYFNPKPVLKVNMSNPKAVLYNEIPPYPNYIYWYPNPVECRDTCGNKVCDAYYEKANNYRNCMRCQRKDPPQCWSSQAQQCVNCPPEQALTACSSRVRYGMPNPNGELHADVAPQNPLYTGCKLY